MEVWKLCAVVLLLSLTSRAQDTVAADIGAHQLERLVMLLTLTECEDLVVALSSSEEDIFQRLQRLAPENNQLSLQPLSKRRLSSAHESEVECRTALTDWILQYGEEMYYDRLTRALQHIGRTDVAMEMGKNINQDKLLSLTRYVEDYHKIVSSFNVPEEQAEAKDNKRVKKVKVSDLSSKDLEVRVWRAPVAPYSKGRLDVIVPVLWGLALGFCGTLLAALCFLCTAMYFCKGSSQLRQQGNVVI